MPYKDPEKRRKCALECTRRWQAKNPEKVRATHKRWAAKNHEKLSISQKQRRDRARAFLVVMKSRPCQDCGKTYPPHIMQFDHRNPASKEFSVSRGILRNIKAVIEEIRKCDLVCANCHAERTQRRRHAA